MILMLTIIGIKGECIFIFIILFVYDRVKGGHYVATHGRDTPDPPYVHANRGYWTDGEESHRAPSERTMSEYTVHFSPINFFLFLFKFFFYKIVEFFTK